MVIIGRWYGGDIKGKFWVGVQPSDDAEFFGACEEPDIHYYVDPESMDEVKEGIETCLKKLGKARKPMDAFFKNQKTYSNEQLNEFINKEASKAWDLPTKELLKWYARLELGIKIKKALEEANGDSIHFWAEC